MIPFTQETANNRLSEQLSPTTGQNYSADIQQNTVRERLNAAIFSNSLACLAATHGALL